MLLFKEGKVHLVTLPRGMNKGKKENSICMWDKQNLQIVFSVCFFDILARKGW